MIGLHTSPQFQFLSVIGGFHRFTHDDKFGISIVFINKQAIQRHFTSEYMRIFYEQKLRNVNVNILRVFHLNASHENRDSIEIVIQTTRKPWYINEPLLRSHPGLPLIRYESNTCRRTVTLWFGMPSD